MRDLIFAVLIPIVIFGLFEYGRWAYACGCIDVGIEVLKGRHQESKDIEAMRVQHHCDWRIAVKLFSGDTK